MILTQESGNLSIFIEFQRARNRKERVVSYLFWSTVISGPHVLLQDVFFLRICNFLSPVIFQSLGVRKRLNRGP